MRTSIAHGGQNAKFISGEAGRKTFAQRGTMGTVGPNFNLFNDLRKSDADDIFFNVANTGEENPNQNFGMEDLDEQEDQIVLRADNADLETGIVIGAVYEIPVTYTHKQQEVRERENRKSDLGEKLKGYQKTMLVL